MTTNSNNNNGGGPRKMRRSRDAAVAVSDKNVMAWQQPQQQPSAGFLDWYSVHGDSAAALTQFQQSPAAAAALFENDNDDDVVPELSKAAQYNCVVLSYLTQTNNNNNNNKNTTDEDDDGGGGKGANAEDSLSPEEKLLKDLERMQDEILLHPQTSANNNRVILPRRSSTHHKRRRNQLILAYNRALVLHTMGRWTESAAICVEHLEPFLQVRRSDSGLDNPSSSQHEEEDDPTCIVACRLALLLLECILTLAVGRAGLDFAVQKLSPTDHRKIPSTDQILEWIENNNAALLDKDAPLKFLLQIYKSRVALADLDQAGKVTDGNIRLARKDMKIAMEIFQHKLRPAFGSDTVSVVSSANSEELSSIGNSNNNNNNKSSEQPPPQQQQQQPPPSSVVLQKLNQSALCLKAHLEQLKGNTKKSLILCSEALAAINNNKDKDSYEALHNNNLAVVYETNNRRHLALHALSKSLRASNDDRPTLFHRDGTARPDPTRPILGNAALCALRARKFVAAYECLAAILNSTSNNNNSHAQQPPHPRGWLRLAEACLGIFADLRQLSNAHKFSLVEVDAEPLGIFIEDGLFLDNVGLTPEELVPILGSPEDLEQVQRNPLLRARAALELALAQQEWLEVDSLLTARLSLSYICLAFGEPRRALTLAQLVEETVQQLQSRSQHPDPATQHFATNATTTTTVSPALQRLRRRQAATARLYAAEATCTLGDLHTAMKYLVGDGKNDAFERVASELSGVTLETAATNGKGKRRLAQAQAMVRSSVGSVTAAMGNPAAKQFANSATAMEDAYLANRERSPARRALIYTLLREGNHATALSMLMSLR